jgi:hypothetical protein
MQKVFTVVLIVLDEEQFRSDVQDNNGLSFEEMETKDTYDFVLAELGWVEQSGIAVKDLNQVEVGQDLPVINSAIEQIERDFASGDLTALEELLRYIPERILSNYISDF